MMSGRSPGGRSYAVTLQVVVAIEEVEDWEWGDIEAQIQDVGSYTLLAPWETDVTAVIVPGLGDAS